MVNYIDFLTSTYSGFKRRIKYENASTAVNYLLHRIYTKVILNKLSSGTLFNSTPIYDREWDVLVVLDGCRFDLIKQVQG